MSLALEGLSHLTVYQVSQPRERHSRALAAEVTLDDTTLTIRVDSKKMRCALYAKALSTAPRFEGKLSTAGNCTPASAADALGKI